MIHLFSALTPSQQELLAPGINLGVESSPISDVDYAGCLKAITGGSEKILDSVEVS